MGVQRKVFVHPAAQKTDGSRRNTCSLSERAQIERSAIEIFADD